MKASDIRELSVADLEARVRELEEERFRLQFRSATETLEDPLRVRAIRKDIARVRTVLRERALGATAGAATGTTTTATSAPAAKRAGRARR
jgi:large subunit ribosomal protein L29